MSKKNKIILISSFIIILIIGVGVSIFAYNNYKFNKIVNKSIEYIDKKEYDKAMITLNLALDDKDNDKKALQLRNMINKYLDAKKLFDKGELEASNNELSKIDVNYSKYGGFKEDVNNLKQDISNTIKQDKEIDLNINKIRDLVNSKKYNDAKDIINILEKQNLKKSSKQQIDDLKARINSELEKIKAETEAKEKAKKESNNVKKSNPYSNFTEPNMTEEEATKLINDKLGKKNDSTYWLMKSTGAAGTSIYIFGERQKGGVHGPHYMVLGTTGEIRTEDGEVVSPAIRQSDSRN